MLGRQLRPLAALGVTEGGGAVTLRQAQVEAWVMGDKGKVLRWGAGSRRGWGMGDNGTVLGWGAGC